MKEITLSVPVKTEHVEEVTLKLPYYGKRDMMHGTEYIRINEDQSIDQCTIYGNNAHAVFTFNNIESLSHSVTEYDISDREEFGKAAGYCINHMNDWT